MHGNEALEDQGRLSSLAFEYVAGTLRGNERDSFLNELANNEEVRFWEEHLMSLQPGEQRVPAKGTWEAISKKVSPNSKDEAKRRWSIMQWLTPFLAGSVLAVVLAFVGVAPHFNKAGPNTDYVAVLTDAEGKAVITALTAEQGKSMWLKWEIDRIADDKSVQLWAKSRRDGEVRPLAVFDAPSITQIPLDSALWRLVTDAEYLILTEEELGGSPIDEPSSNLVAKGFCVRFSPTQQSS